MNTPSKSAERSKRGTKRKGFSGIMETIGDDVYRAIFREIEDDDDDEHTGGLRRSRSGACGAPFAAG